MAEKTKQKITMSADVAALSRILTDNPSMEQRIRETIEYHLKKGIDDETYVNILFSLNILVGIKVADLIVNSCKANSGEFFQDIRRQTKNKSVDKVLPFLQYLTALYGPEIEKSYDVFGQESDDWSSAEVTAFRTEGELKRWLVDLDLAKYNGEKVYLRMRLLSALALANRLLREIGMVPKEAISKKAIERFNEATKAFQEKFLSSRKD